MPLSKSSHRLLLIGLLLCLALGVTIFAGVTTVQAFRNFTQQHTLARQGDVDSIRAWMTIPYIAHTYHVPESYLVQSLHVQDKHTLKQDTLHDLAIHEHLSDETIIQSAQTTIQSYRQQHQLHYPRKADNIPSHYTMRGGTGF